ncbi:MAG: rhodanese-like domain-containing protein [Dehalococcoidia bacterium]
MATKITREDVQRLTAAGAQLVDALPEEEYAQERIAGAINLPLKKLNRQLTRHLPKDQRLIVYCYDAE